MMRGMGHVTPQSLPLCPIDMSYLHDIKRPDGTSSLKWAESQCDVMDASSPRPPPGGTPALLDGLYAQLSHRPGHPQQQRLLHLARRRHQLLLTRQAIVHQMSLTTYLRDACKLLERGPPLTTLLCRLCLRLQQLTSHTALLCRRLRGHAFLHPASTLDSSSFIDHAPSMKHTMCPASNMESAPNRDPTSFINSAPTISPASTVDHTMLFTSNIDPASITDPASTMQDPSATLILTTFKATLLTERLIVLALRRAAQVPANEGTSDLLRSLTTYNQALADLSKPAVSSAQPRPFCLSRTLDILAEERGRALAEHVYRSWCERGLDELCRRELEAHLNPPLQGQRSPSGEEVDGGQVTKDRAVSHALSLESFGALVQEDRSRVTKDRAVSLAGSPHSLGALVQEDRSQVTPLLQVLEGLDTKRWKRGGSSSGAALYSQYCTSLWPAVYSCLRGAGVLPALPSLPEGLCEAAVRVLREMLTADDVPEPCASLGRSLCQSLLWVRSLITWDTTLCRALSSALTDKCAASMSEGPASASHSRTCAVLLALCQQTSNLLLPPTSGQQCRDGGNVAERPSSSPPSCDLRAVTCRQGALSRGVVSLHLCHTWLQSRAQIFQSSASLSQLVLITHGDLPVIKDQCRAVLAAMHHGDSLPPTHALYMKIQRSRDVLEGLVVSLPRALSSLCSRRARDVFQHMMPAGRHWRGKLVTGPDLAASEYAQVALGAVVVPVLDGVRSLCPEEQGSAVCAAVTTLMEAWMGHILQEKIKFSLQGALQLRRDFESVRDVLRQSRMSPEVVQAALMLQAFTQADNAVVCLLQQPSRKTYLQAGGCAIFPCCPALCRVAVDTMSDSLQSLDSLERRVWDGDVSGPVLRHSHDSYLPHNQRQWLSLRAHRTWNGLNLPWEGREVSEG